MSNLAIYVQGEIYPGGSNDPAAVVDAITASDITTPILGLLHVNCSKETCPNGKSPAGSHDGDIAFNDTLIIRDGEYVGDPGWPATIASLRAGSVGTIFASFGGAGVPDYERIAAVMAKYGTGPGTPLYDNFNCLKETLGVDGIDFDDEDSFDQQTIVEFGQMLLGLDLEITFCPYGAQSFWQGCIDALGAGNVAWLNLQCYAGGKGNDPAQWTGMGVPVVAGICSDCCCPQTTCSAQDVEAAFRVWSTGGGSVPSDCWAGSSSGPADLAGGFIWTYGSVGDQLDAYVNAIRAGLGGQDG